jgi:molybdopterin synthase sulfur carrier subunit
MPRLRFTSHLRRFFPKLEEMSVAGATVAETVAALDHLHPGLAGYITDDQGALRKHVNIFVNASPIRDRERLSDPLGPDDEVFILQALSGG